MTTGVTCQAAVLRGVGREWEIEDITLVDSEEIVLGSCTGVQDVLGLRYVSKCSCRRNVVGMNMSIDHKSDTDPTFFGFVQIHLRVIDGVAHGAQALTPSTEHVGCRDDRVGVKQLPKNHETFLRMFVCERGSGPVASGRPLARQS